jgi:tetratricopeptide (TPR) repeat protein
MGLKIAELLEGCRIAREANDWPKLEKLTSQILEQAQISNLDDKTLIQTIRSYLSSIIGTGEFVVFLEAKNLQVFEKGLQKLKTFLKDKPHIHKSVSRYEYAADEIRILCINPIASNRTKIARSLRILARPDLAIEILEDQLQLSAKNYYTLTTLCGAYCDIYRFDKAIEVAEQALRFNPADGRMYPLNALTRAHTQRFKKDGDIEDIEKALMYAKASIDLRIDAYSARSYIAAAIASRDEVEIESATAIVDKTENSRHNVDENALVAAYEAANEIPAEMIEAYFNETQESEVEEIAESSLELNVFQICLEKYGWEPNCASKRNMTERFSNLGWFFQNDSDLNCPNCDSPKLSSIRKHYVSFGKPSHYWALVCRGCRQATDSIGLGLNHKLWKKEFEGACPTVDICPTCVSETRPE